MALRDYLCATALDPGKNTADKLGYATALRQARAGISIAIRKDVADTINLFERRAREELLPVLAPLNLAGAAAPGGAVVA